MGIENLKELEVNRRLVMKLTIENHDLRSQLGISELNMNRLLNVVENLADLIKSQDEKLDLIEKKLGFKK